MSTKHLPVLWTLALVAIAVPVAARAQLVRQANTTLNLPASLPTATGYTTTNALGTLTFSEPIAVRNQPGRNDRLFVVERAGILQLVDLSGSTPTKSLFFDLAAFSASRGETLNANDENGFLSMAFHPNYASNGLFYVFYSFNAGGSLFQRIARFKVPGANPGAATSFTQAQAAATNPPGFRPLITQVDRAGNHNGGDLHFGPDGYLYASVGDEGSAGDFFNNGRFINKNFFSAILRLDVDEDASGNVVGRPGSLAQNNTPAHPAINPGAYLIPADNPFIGATSHQGQSINPASVRTEFFASGLRNPFRFSIDRPTGRVFVGDVGQNAYEEINLVPKGADCGWSWREGLHPYRSGQPPANVFTPLEPIFEYPQNGSSKSVTGGLVYRGSRLTELFEAYVFADFVDGTLWALRPNGPNGTWTSQTIGNVGGFRIVGFGEDPRDGDLLLCNRGFNQISRLVRSGTTGTNPPALLSQTGAFSNLATLTPNPGIVPYDNNVPFWSDHAQKARWFAVPNVNDKLTFSASGNWAFPAGTVWVKHFDLPLDRNAPNGAKRRIETRFIVKNAAGSYGITYKWRADNSDADLVPEEGATETLTGLTNPATQTWTYPSRNDCRSCHTPVAGHALSFNTHQLNRTFTYGSQTPNQIKAFSDAGYFTAPVAGVNNLPAFAKATDATQSLEWRVRSYLAVNCVSCHQPGGSALGSWDARPTTPTDSANLVRGMLNNSGGDPANRFAVPGDTAHSMVLKRVRGDAGTQRMPPLATNVRDLEAESLLTNWINLALPARRSLAEYRDFYFPNVNDPRRLPGADGDGDGHTNEQEFLGNTDPTNSASRPAGFTSLTTVAEGSSLQIAFTQPANRSALVETSTDLTSWSLWDVPGNNPDYADTATTRTITAPLDEAKRFYRLRLSAP